MQKELGKIIAGTDVCIDNIKARRVKLLIIATDASDKTKKNMKYVCEQNNTFCLEFGDIDGLSKAIGDNNKAIIAIKERNFANEIYKIIGDNEIEDFDRQMPSKARRTKEINLVTEEKSRRKVLRNKIISGGEDLWGK